MGAVCDKGRIETGSSGGRHRRGETKASREKDEAFVASSATVEALSQR